MTYGMIATWQMAQEGVQKGQHILEGSGSARKAIVTAVQEVENNPSYQSVGFGGLPNERGVVQLDAAFMDGDTFDIGAVAGMEGIKNPIEVAELLSHEQFNRFLIGRGATEEAKSKGFESIDLLTNQAKKSWEQRTEKVRQSKLSPYDGHDTVGMVCLDEQGSMATGTSSSGLFMKKNGRIGDTPLSGSGFYVDSEIGGATATGLGEDLMKGCLSYETVRLMGGGLSPQEAVNQALFVFTQKLQKKKGKIGACSLVSMNNKGEWGVATNVIFSFVVMTEYHEATIYAAFPAENGKTRIEKATNEWLEKNE